MISKKLSLFVVALILAAANISRADSSEAKKIYFYLGGGSALSVHGSEFQDKILDLRSRGGTKDPIGVLDLGIYKRINAREFWGIAPRFILEDYSENYLATEDLALHAYNINASYIYCLEEGGPEKLSLRFDAGPTYVREYQKVSGVKHESNYGGFNLGASIQYGFKATEVSWVFVNVGAFAASTSHASLLGAAFTIGFLL